MGRHFRHDHHGHECTAGRHRRHRVSPATTSGRELFAASDKAGKDRQQHFELWWYPADDRKWQFGQGHGRAGRPKWSWTRPPAERVYQAV